MNEKAPSIPPVPDGWEELKSGLVVPDANAKPTAAYDSTLPVEKDSDDANEYTEDGSEQMSPLSKEEIIKVLDGLGEDQESELNRDQSLAIYRIKEFLRHGKYMNRQREEDSLGEFLQNELDDVINQGDTTYQKQLYTSGEGDDGWTEVEGVGYHGTNGMGIVVAYAMMRGLNENPQAARVYSLGENPGGIELPDENDYFRRIRGDKVLVRRTTVDGRPHYEARLSTDD